MRIAVWSPAFPEGSRIPAEYTCEGRNVSPPLEWGKPPARTRSFALIVDDPDAPGGVFTHWVLFNIPAVTSELPAGIPTKPSLPSGALQGKNDFGGIGYAGPCPPPAAPHRYQFTLYALDQLLDLEAGVSKNQLLKAMQGHILADGRLVGTFER